MTLTRLLVFAALLSMDMAAVAQAQTHPCASEPEAAARLACYDRAFPPPPEVHEAARERAESRFGLAAAREKEAGAAPVDARDPERIQSRVARIGNPGSAQRIFHLENGQAWIQADARSTGQVQPGDIVQVRKGLMGAYQLVMPNGVILRVRRTR